jgi:type IV pilus assembly protein PilW
MNPATVRHRCRERWIHSLRPQDGLTIVELMISIALGLLIVLAASALLGSSRTSYAAQDEGARSHETGRYAVEIITRALRQTAYENWDRDEAAILNVPDLSAGIAGLDSRSLKETESGIESPLLKAVNGSDVLAVRFIGSGAGANGDGTILNCAGYGVAEPADIETDRGWSIFYVATDKSGEPELRCKYFGKTSWNSEAIARGVESFQVLYGVDTDQDGVANRYLNATAVDELDRALVLEGHNATLRAVEKNRKTHWKKVVSVKVSLLIRGSQAIRAGSLNSRYDLFGEHYSKDHSQIDIGTRINETDLPTAFRNRSRKVFSTTVQLKLQTGG